MDESESLSEVTDFQKKRAPGAVVSYCVTGLLFVHTIEQFASKKFAKQSKCLISKHLNFLLTSYSPVFL